MGALVCLIALLQQVIQSCCPRDFLQVADKTQPPPPKVDAIAQTCVKRPVARGKLQAAIIHAYNTAPLSRQSTKNAIETMHVFQSIGQLQIGPGG